MKLFLSIILVLQTYSFAKVSLKQMISQMLIVQFQGQKPEEKSVKKIEKSISRGEISGVLIDKKNISIKAQLRELISFLKDGNSSVIVALDDQINLKKDDGFLAFPNYKTVSQEYDIKKAKSTYDKMAKEIKNLGINLLLAPRVNRGNYNETNTYSSQTGIISTYANIFLSSFEGSDILLGLKYFPADKNSTWDYESLRPFYDLIKNKKAKSVVVSCFYMKDFDESKPSCASKKIINSILKKEFKFDGLVIGDFRQVEDKNLSNTIIEAINAGVDMIILNDFHTSQNSVKKAILKAIWDKKIDKDTIKNIYKKITNIKNSM